MSLRCWLFGHKWEWVRENPFGCPFADYFEACARWPRCEATTGRWYSEDRPSLIHVGEAVGRGT